MRATVTVVSPEYSTSSFLSLPSLLRDQKSPTVVSSLWRVHRTHSRRKNRRRSSAGLLHTVRARRDGELRTQVIDPSASCLTPICVSAHFSFSPWPRLATSTGSSVFESILPENNSGSIADFFLSMWEIFLLMFSLLVEEPPLNDVLSSFRTSWLYHLCVKVKIGCPPPLSVQKIFTVNYENHTSEGLRTLVSMTIATTRC